MSGLSLAWEKNTVLSDMLTCLAWLSGHLLTFGTLTTVWFVAELWFANVDEQEKLQMFPHPKPRVHQWLSWCLCRPGSGEVLFLGLALNLFSSLAQDELLLFSAAAVPEYTGQGKGKPLGFSCFHFTQHLLCPYHCRYGQPFACQGQSVLSLASSWTASGLGGSSGVAHFSFHLLPLQEGRSFALLSSHTYLGFFSVRLFQITVFFAP